MEERVGFYWEGEDYSVFFLGFSTVFLRVWLEETSHPRTVFRNALIVPTMMDLGTGARVTPTSRSWGRNYRFYR